MKSIFKKTASTLSLLIIGVAIGISGLAMANGELTLEQQLSELTLTLKEVFLENAPNQQGPNDYAPQPMSDLIYSDAFNCLANDGNWPVSNIYKEPEGYHINFFLNSGNTSMSQFIDLNGDGLVDYVYDFDRSSCVYLNNGRGFDLEYKCKATLNNNVWTFRGDCAEI